MGTAVLGLSRKRPKMTGTGSSHQTKVKDREGGQKDHMVAVLSHLSHV